MAPSDIIYDEAWLDAILLWGRATEPREPRLTLDAERLWRYVLASYARSGSVVERGWDWLDTTAGAAFAETVDARSRERPLRSFGGREITHMDLSPIRELVEHSTQDVWYRLAIELGEWLRSEHDGRLVDAGPLWLVTEGPVTVDTCERLLGRSGWLRYWKGAVCVRRP